MVSVTNLGTFSGLSTNDIVAINNMGQIAGTLNLSPVRGFISQNEVVTTVPPLAGTNLDFILGINDAGATVGYSVDYSGQGSTNPTIATIWENGVATPFPLEGYSNSRAVGINNSGQVILSAYSATNTLEALLWQNGSYINLGTLDTGLAQADAINDEGQVVGTSESGNFQHAFLWQNGKMTDLGLVGGAYDSTAAVAINNSGIIVGDELLSSYPNNQLAVVWLNGKALSLPGLTQNGSTAHDINDSGIVVGQSQSQAVGSGNRMDAVAWYDGTVIDLNSLAPSGWQLGNAISINNQNEIVGTGTYNGATTWFELTLPSVISLTSAEAVTDTSTFASLIVSPMTISDSAANISANFSSLETLAAVGQIASIAFTDSGYAALSLTPAQLTGDTKALALISGNFYVEENASAANLSFSGLSGHGNVAVFSADASDYSVTSSSDGKSVVITDAGTGRNSTDTITNITALQFTDFTDFVAQTPGPANAVTSGNIVELYSAVLAREPDVPGLAFYEGFLVSNPTTSLQQFAEYFLSSSEYAGNAAHNYAQTEAGDEQFIRDSYTNLLHRTPTADEVAFYETKLIAPALAGLTPGTTAYADTAKAAHALTLVYFSASAEFLSDVQVTAQTPSSASHWLVLI